ncbi:hypothetical protein [Bradyrhizobium sp.]|nr:hypothetical protein [Bradyrhizobium sp.]
MVLILAVTPDGVLTIGTYDGLKAVNVILITWLVFGRLFDATPMQVITKL